MHVSLTPKLKQFVHSKVEDGQYNNASEVVREALRLMSERDATYRAKLKALRQAIVVGEQSGPAVEWDFGKFMKSLDSGRKKSRRSS